MDPLTLGLLAAGGATLIGSAVGGSSDEADKAQQRKQMMMAAAGYNLNNYRFLQQQARVNALNQQLKAWQGPQDTLRGMYGNLIGPQQIKPGRLENDPTLTSTEYRAPMLERPMYDMNLMDTLAKWQQQTNMVAEQKANATLRRVFGSAG